MNLKMRNANVCIALIDSEGKTKGGIIIPSTVRQGILQLGRVIAAGPGELVQGTFKEMDLKVDDEIIFDSSRSEPLVVDGDTVYVCNMVDVIAILTGKHTIGPGRSKSTK
jgi:chaperonin GroES